MTLCKHCENRTEVAEKQEPATSFNFLGHAILKEESYFRQKEQSLSCWNLKFTVALPPNECHIIAQGEAKAQQQPACTIKQSHCWVEIWPLSSASSSFCQTDFSFPLYPPVHLYNAFQYSIICKTSIPLSSLMKLVNRSGASTQGQNGKWTASTILSAKTSSSEPATSSEKLLATD